MGAPPPAPPDKGRLLDRRPAAGSRSAPSADVSDEAAAFADSTIDVGALFQKVGFTHRQQSMHLHCSVCSRSTAMCMFGQVIEPVTSCALQSGMCTACQACCHQR
jgi:hypothetical protein